jgi:hypothetical protein
MHMPSRMLHRTWSGALTLAMGYSGPTSGERLLNLRF